MRESLLHFVWQFQKFDSSDLRTAQGSSVKILSTGSHNDDSGPDFLNAKILIDDMIWVGHVELHIRSSDWSRHGHHKDEAYNNVILHVVYEHDKEVSSNHKDILPTLELTDRIEPSLLVKCNELLNSPEKIPCAYSLSRVNPLQVTSMIESAVVHRLERKSNIVLERLHKNRGSWEETAFQLLAINFGFKVNADAFEKLSVGLRHKTLLKHTGNSSEIESLLFGQAGFMPNQSEDTYVQELIRQYGFLSHKYALSDSRLFRIEWKFLRMRPSNFPTVRLAQFAAFLAKNPKFFQTIVNFSTISEVRDMFKEEPSAYWQDHYDVGKQSKRRNKGLGRSSIDLLLINTVAPVLAAYAIQNNSDLYMEKAIDLLSTTKGEKNKITDVWLDLGTKGKSAFDSQGLIEMHNEFCLKKRCLSCKIGTDLVNR